MRRRAAARVRNSARFGLAMLEFALVLPMFVMILLGIIEFSRAYQVAQMLTVAVREGGRMAILGNITIYDGDGDVVVTPNERIRNDVQNFLTASGLNGGMVDVYIVEHDNDDEEPSNPDSVDLSKADRDTYFMVRATVPFTTDTRAALVEPWFMPGTTLSAHIVMRHE